MRRKFYLLVTRMFWFSFLFCQLAIAGSPYEKAFKRYNQHAYQPLNHINSTHLEDLKSGKVVVTIDNSALGWRATGLLVVNEPMVDIWTATRDECQKQQKSTFEYVVEDHGGGAQDWYGLIDLPWPLKNRHWIIKTRPNLKLASASCNKSWERYWSLTKNAEASIKEAEEDGELPNHAEGAIFTPTNAGAWFVIQVAPNTSILGYQVTTSIGGVVPDKLMMQFVSSTMDEMLSDMKERAKTIRKHYVAPHPMLYGGDKRVIPFFK